MSLPVTTSSDHEGPVPTPARQPEGRLRSATNEDVRLYLLDLEHRHGGPDHWSARQFDAYSRRRRHGHGLLVFADPRGVVVGYLAYVLTRKTLAVTRLLVRPTCRRKGVASQLLAHAHMVAGPRTVHACLSERRLEALYFFRRAGIASLGQRGPLGEDRELVVILTKPPVEPRPPRGSP